MSHDHHMQGAVDIGFWQLWDPLQMIIAMAMVILYIRLISGIKYELKTVRLSQKAMFLMGAAIYLLAAGGPLNYYGHHYLLSAHMLQQSLLYYVVPPLMIFGTPKFVFEALIKNKFAKKLLETHLLISLLAFDILFSFYHLPMVFDVVMSNYVIMVITHLVLFGFAIQMWWPIISPLPEIDQTSELRKMAFIILGAVLLTPACALIIFASKPVYAPYMGVPQLLEILTPMDDQQLGGILMKLVQELSFGSILAYLFFRWYRRENSMDNLDMNPVHPQLAMAKTMADTGKDTKE